MSVDHAVGTRSSREGPASSTDPAPVNYHDLIARCLGNLAFAERILLRFEERMDEELAQLDAEYGRRDAPELARLAHRLKGASGNVSADKLSEVFARLEQLGRTGRLEQVPACLDDLRAEWARFKQRNPAGLLAAAGGESMTSSET